MNSKQFLKEGFLEDAQEAHSDHEVQMARVDCYYAAEHAIVLHKLLRNISEEQGLEGWVASKITLANDYLKSVREHLEYQMMNVDAGEDDFLPLAEGLKPVKKNSVVESTAPVAEDEEEKFQDFERGPWYVILKGKAVSVNGVPKKFNWLNGAKTYFRSMMDKNPEMAQKIKREYDEASDKKSVIYYTKNLPADNTTSTEQPVSEGEKPGLWANIRAKRERIKGGSGERMRKPGSKGAPSDADIKSIRAASESVVKESDFHSQFAAMIDDMKKSGKLKTGDSSKSQAKYAPEQSRAELESRLRELESEFDPAYQYSDDYSFWTKQNAIAREIASIKKKLGSQGVSEGYSLKKTNVSKYMEPGDTDEYTQDINIKDTDYEIINNKTGQVVGTASWTTNDYFGPGALKITMKNGATRYLDIWASERGNPQTAFNRFVKDPKTAKKYKEQGVTEGSGAPEITPGMKTQYGTVVSVNGNTVTVKTSNGELTTVNIHDIQQGVAEGFPYDVDHMPGPRKSLADVNKTSKYVVATNAIGDAKEHRVTVNATSKNNAMNLAFDHFEKKGLKPRIDFDGLRLISGVAEGYKNTYNVGDRVDSPLGTGTIVAVSKNVNVDGRVRVKLDDPSKAGEDGKYKDSFVLNTTQLKHIDEQGVAEGSEIKIPTEDGIGWQDIRLLAGEGKLTQKTIKQAIEIIRKQRKQKQGVAEGWEDEFRTRQAAEKAAKSAQEKEYRQYGITARKSGGDDAYSWAVFINGHMMVNGLSKREVLYYKKIALEKAKEKQGVAEGFVDDIPADSMIDTMNKISGDAKAQRYHHLQKLLKQSKNPKTIAQIKALLAKEFPQGVTEDLADDLAKYARWQAAVGGAVGLGIGAANYADDQRPKIEIGGQQAYYVENPDWGKVPYNAMTLTGKDGKEYKVWTVKGGGGKVWYATPAEKVKEGVAEGFKNTYNVGDRVDGPLGTGTIVAVSKNVNVDGRVRVKLDDPSKAGEDGKYKDSFVLTTTQLKHISEQGVAEGSDQNYQVGDQVLTQVGGRWIPAVITKPINAAGNYGVKFKVGSKVMNYVSSPNQLKKQGVAEGSDNSVEALIQMYNNRDQKIVKTKVFRSEDEANRWADRNNATILKLKDVAKKSTLDETSAGSIAGVVNPKIKNKSKVGTLFGGTYKQQKDK